MIVLFAWGSPLSLLLSAGMIGLYYAVVGVGFMFWVVTVVLVGGNLLALALAAVVCGWEAVRKRRPTPLDERGDE